MAFIDNTNHPQAHIGDTMRRKQRGRILQDEGEDMSIERHNRHNAIKSRTYQKTDLCERR